MSQVIVKSTGDGQNRCWQYQGWNCAKEVLMESYNFAVSMLIFCTCVI
jgi:hypothetical protein